MESLSNFQIKYDKLIIEPLFREINWIWKFPTYDDKEMIEKPDELFNMRTKLMIERFRKLDLLYDGKSILPVERSSTE